MKATDKLRYPDFTIPGSVVILIGISFAVFQFVVMHDYHGWIFASTLVGAGFLMLARMKLGTVMLAGGIGYGVYSRIFIEGLSDERLLSILLSSFILLGLLSCMFGQVMYFAAQGRSKQYFTNEET